MKKILKLAVGISLVLSLASCSNIDKQNEESKLIVGATAVPHAEILNLVVDDLENEGITLEVKEFSDYMLLNPSTVKGEIDVNFFQHKPYLDSYNNDSGEELISVANIHLEPIRVYSKNVINLDSLEDGAKVGVPNDVSNEGRALLLLEDLGLIKLSENVGVNATPNDIVENPKKLEIIELDAYLLPRSLDDVDIAIINTNVALESNLSPELILATESKDSPYANILVTTKDKSEKEKVQKLVEVLQSAEVKEFIEKEYEGSVIPAF